MLSLMFYKVSKPSIWIPVSTVDIATHLLRDSVSPSENRFVLDDLLKSLPVLKHDGFKF